MLPYPIGIATPNLSQHQGDGSAWTPLPVGLVMAAQATRQLCGPAPYLP